MSFKDYINQDCTINESVVGLDVDKLVKKIKESAADIKRGANVIFKDVNKASNVEQKLGDINDLIQSRIIFDTLIKTHIILCMVKYYGVTNDKRLENVDPNKLAATVRNLAVNGAGFTSYDKDTVDEILNDIFNTCF